MRHSNVTNTSLSLPDIDECAEISVCLQGECMNTNGSFICNCPEGLQFKSDRSDCDGRYTGVVCELLVLYSSTSRVKIKDSMTHLWLVKYDG